MATELLSTLHEDSDVVPLTQENPRSNALDERPRRGQAYACIVLSLMASAGVVMLALPHSPAAAIPAGSLPTTLMKKEEINSCKLCQCNCNWDCGGETDWSSCCSRLCCAKVCCAGTSPAECVFTTAAPVPPSQPKKMFCKFKFNVHNYGNPMVWDDGYTLHGPDGGKLLSAAVFDLRDGGWISYTMNLSNVDPGNNANLYLIFPPTGDASRDDCYGEDCYCDGQGGGVQTNSYGWCIELDVIEANGPSDFALTWHTCQAHNNDCGCGSWGCLKGYGFGGKHGCNEPSESGIDGMLPFNVNITFDTEGCMVTTFSQGSKELVVSKEHLAGNGAHDDVILKDWLERSCGEIARALESDGVVIASSLWSGWEPGVGGAKNCASCSPSQETCTMEDSSMTISNMRIYGSIFRHGEGTEVCEEVDDVS